MDRWDQVGRVAAYGAALALTPYLLIKVSWVAGALLGLLPVGTGFGTVEWVVLNGATIAMAAVGISVALALVRPWGMRIPGAPLAFCAWVGAGFLVPVLPYAVLSWLLGPEQGAPEAGGDAGPSMPAWEAALVHCGFVGMGLGLAMALPAYLRRRWPDVFAGRLREGRQGPRRALAAAAVGAAVGFSWLYWAVGGTAGVDRPGEREPAWYVLSAVFGAWACVAADATRAAVRGRPAHLPRWGPLVLGWLGSGSLFAGAAGSWRSRCTWRSRNRPMRPCPRASRSRRFCTSQRWGRAPRCCARSFVRGWCHSTRSPIPRRRQGRAHRRRRGVHPWSIIRRSRRRGAARPPGG